MEQDRVDLDVTFQERETVKQLGARWDPQAKTWYVPAGLDMTRFREWLPAVVPPGPRVRVQVLAITEPCWKCDVPTTAIVGVLDPRRGFIEAQGHVTEVLAVLLSRTWLEDRGVGRLKRRYSGTTESSSMSNGCRSCDVLLGWFPLYEAHCELVQSESYRSLVIGVVELPEATLRRGG